MARIIKNIVTAQPVILSEAKNLVWCEERDPSLRVTPKASKSARAEQLQNIEIEGQPAVALFDTDAVYTYVRSSLVRDVPRRVVTRPARVALGGKDIEIHELCLIEGKIEGLDFFGNAVPVDDIGRADGHELDVLIGALVMEQWEIRLDPKNETLDLEGLRRREFTEF